MNNWRKRRHVSGLAEGTNSAANHSNRGKVFERLLDQAHAYYRVRKLAHVCQNPNEWRYTTASQYQKLATKAPQIVARTASGFYLVSVRSDVDFSGTMKLADGTGRSIYFDAKETAEASFPLSQVKQHQINKLLDHAACGAIAGIMLRFARYERIFFLPVSVVDEAVTKMQFMKGRKSISLADAIEKGHEIPKGKMVEADWLEVVNDHY